MCKRGSHVKPPGTSPGLFTSEQEACWTQAAEILAAASDELLVVPGADAYFTKASGTIRRRRPWIRWFLGNLAAFLDYPSVEHFLQALHLLQERRMNIPWLRLQILCDQGQVLLRLHHPQAALASYGQALALLQKDPTHDAACTLYRGLCEASRQLLAYEPALSFGKKALAICPTDQERQAVLALLGHVFLDLNQTARACAAYREALALAGHAAEHLESLLALIECMLAERDLPTARSYCAQALEDRANLPRRVQGRRFALCGQVALAQAAAAQEPLARRLYEESVAWYRQALDACPQGTDVLSALARLLLEMVEPDSQVTQTVFWQEASQAVMHPGA
jgi:tetratricopeptide (TPR) repeat protein